MSAFYTVSDLHVDFPPNFVWLEKFYQQHKSSYKNDVLIIPGDISHKLNLIQNTLLRFKEIFKEVAYTYGNHELWIDKKMGINSYEKAELIEEFCKKNEIRTTPFIEDSTFVVPIFSWYDSAFATDDEKNDTSLDGWMDSFLCDFNKTNEELCHFFHNKNLFQLPKHNRIISFSHFIPRRDLIPNSYELSFKGFPAVAGNRLIEDYLRDIGSKIHISGHAHINFDTSIDGVQYIQNSLKYPHEQNKETPFELIKLEF